MRQILKRKRGFIWELSNSTISSRAKGSICRAERLENENPECLLALSKEVNHRLQRVWLASRTDFEDFDVAFPRLRVSTCCTPCSYFKQSHTLCNEKQLFLLRLIIIVVEVVSWMQICKQWPTAPFVDLKKKSFLFSWLEIGMQIFMIMLSSYHRGCICELKNTCTRELPKWPTRKQSNFK